LGHQGGAESAKGIIVFEDVAGQNIFSLGFFGPSLINVQHSSRTYPRIASRIFFCGIPAVFMSLAAEI